MSGRWVESFNQGSLSSSLNIKFYIRKGVELFKHSLRLAGGSNRLNIKLAKYVLQMGRVT